MLLEFRVWCLGMFRVQGLGFRVLGFDFSRNCGFRGLELEL